MLRRWNDLNDYAKNCHEANRKWWFKEGSKRKLKRNKGELICLMHSELSEMMEGERKDLMDDHIPYRRMAEVEAADLLIRLFDYCGAFGYDLEGAFQDKMAYNRTRTDHSYAARNASGGKKW